MFFNSVEEDKVLKFIESNIFSEFFRENGDLKINIDILIENLAKHKKPRKDRLFPEWDIWELGFINNLYKIHLAIKDDHILIFGFIDALSSYKILISNKSLSNEQKSVINDFRRKVLNVDIEVNNFLYNKRFSDISGFIYIIEHI